MLRKMKANQRKLIHKESVMLRSIVSCLFLAIFIQPCPTKLPINYKLMIQPKQRFELPQKVTSSGAEIDYRTAVERIQKLQEDHPEMMKISCSFGEFGDYACIGDFYAPPFPPAVFYYKSRPTKILERIQLFNSQNKVPILSWTPLEAYSIKSPNVTAMIGESLQSLINSANQDLVFNCQDNHECNQAIYALNKPKDEEAIAVCDVAKIGDNIGAPEECEYLAIVKSKKVYVRSVVGFVLNPAVVEAGRPDFSILMGANPRPEKETAQKACGEALRSAPLKLEVYNEDDNDSILGVSNDRKSDVLDPYREKVTIRINMNSIKGDTKFLCLKSSSSIYVNRYNTTNTMWYRYRSQMPETSTENKLITTIFRK